jgi:putative toxin-antitoxin system antitoxin component (TIGR02293 family)
MYPFDMSETLGWQIISNWGLFRQIEEGVQVATALDLLRDQGLVNKEIAYLVISAQAIKRRIERGEKLKPAETERYIRVLDVVALSEKVFANHSKALGWLRRGNKRLAERTPLSLLVTHIGCEVVREMLIQIDEGVYV